MYTRIHGEAVGIMPPGHECWFAFDGLVATCEWERGRKLRFLRDEMVSAQVLWYLSLIAGLWITLGTNLALVLGFEIACGTFVLMCVPFIFALACALFVRWSIICPMYDQMCRIIVADSALLPLLKQAGKDDYVLLPALEIIEHRLAYTNR